MISLIITAYKEEVSLRKALTQIADPSISGYNKPFEIIQVTPDENTLNAGKEVIREINNKKVKFIQIRDNETGKPHALNKAFKKVSGDIVILTDGDVYFERNSLQKLIENFLEEELDAACGRVKSRNRKNYFMGYISHLMTSAAHHKRLVELQEHHIGKGTQIIRKTKFFPLTGYMLIFNKTKLEYELGEDFIFPTNCLVDDAYLSYVIYNYKLKLGYISQAHVLAKFPTHIKDYMKQKKRSTGGFLQLWDYGVVKNETNSRSFFQELRYFWFPIKYAQTPKEYYWSLLFFPLRLYLWFMIWIERKIFNKDFVKTWVRIESTK